MSKRLGALRLAVAALALVLAAGVRTAAAHGSSCTHATLTMTATPASVPANGTTAVHYDITVKNDGPSWANDLVLQGLALSSRLSNPSVHVSSSSPTVTWTVVNVDPLKITVPHLPNGATLTVRIDATAKPTCSDYKLQDDVTLTASNLCDNEEGRCNDDDDDDDEGTTVTANAKVLVNKSGVPEVCNGIDDDCDGYVDEGGDALCGDGNACNGNETCGGQAGCKPGQPLDCHDTNACTTDSCNPSSGCVHDAVANCTPCTSAGQCGDSNACTTDTCDAGVCQHTSIANCTPCTTAAQCGDSNACTTDTCVSGACQHATIANCTPCTSAGQCGDSNACTTDTCDAGVCQHASIANCTPCTMDDGCMDGNGCTTDTCQGGACAHVMTPGCVPCASAAACADQNPCTSDVCNANGVCEHPPVAGCTPCTTDAGCQDDDPCTQNRCGEDGSCQSSAIPGCTRCTTAAQCDDHDGCTDDTCAAGACEYLRRPGCSLCTPSTEICTDGIDNDCDGLVDCADPNCSAAPSCSPPPKEICGNCIDDDGDGLIDYDDPDCCSQVTDSHVMKFVSEAKGRRRLTLRTLHARFTPVGFDPLHGDTTIQITDRSGALFCVTIDAKHWMKMHRTWSFWDKQATYAHGLTDGIFIPKRDGRILFKAFGRHIPLRTPQGAAHVTVRVGGQCSRATALFKSKRNRIVFP